MNGQKPKAMIIVEEVAPNVYRVRRAKNWTQPLVGNLIVGVDLTRSRLESLVEQGVDVVVDQAGYKRRWTP